MNPLRGPTQVCLPRRRRRDGVRQGGGCGHATGAGADGRTVTRAASGVEAAAAGGGGDAAGSAADGRPLGAIKQSNRQKQSKNQYHL